MANPNNPHSFLFEKSNTGAAPIMERAKTVSNASIGVGDPLVLVTGASPGLKLAGVTSTAIFGVSQEAVTGVTGVRKSVAYIPALPGYVFSGQHVSTLNLTAGYLAKPSGIAGATAGKITLNVASTVSTLQIVGIKPFSAASTYAELLFVIAKSSYTGQP